jgi:hypothetical protein
VAKAAGQRQDGSKPALLDQLRRTPIVQIACERVGVSRATYYRWRKDDTEFMAATDEAIAEGAALINDMAESQLLSAIKDKNMTAIIFWLKHHHRTYATRVQVDATHHLLDEQLTPEQQLIVEQALRLSGLTGGDDENADTPSA